MILAKLALGFGGTMVLAGGYVFHEGVIRVEEKGRGGEHVRVWVPAALVPLAMHAVPQERMEHVVERAGPWMPTLRALAHELEKYPDTDFVEVTGPDAHVKVAVHGGSLQVDVEAPEQNVHVLCPLVVIEDISRQVEDRTPRRASHL